jgi:peptide/nickel transport system permease protein
MLIDRPDLAVVRSLRRRVTARPGSRTGTSRLPWFSLSVLVAVALLGIFGSLIEPHSATKIDLAHTLVPPVFASGGSWSHPLGTDQLGRDVLSRLIGGARVSLLVALAVVLISGLAGLAVGIVSGYSGGRLDALLMRVTDAALAFPVLLLALVLVAVSGPGTRNVIVVLAAAGWASYARVIRSEVASLRTSEFVSMSRVMGGRPAWIMRRHLLPNVASSLLVLATLQFGLAVITEGALSFLGMGVPPPAPDWGSMMADGQNLLVSAWWVAAFPGVALCLTVLASNLLGDWLRTHGDPASRR